MTQHLRPGTAGFAPALLAACLAFAATPPGAARADTCHDEIAALYDGGPLDPFVQPAYAYDTTVTAADGTVRYEMHTVFDTPMRSLNGLKGQPVYLAIGTRTWTAPDAKGPWSETPNSLPDDLEAFHKANRDELAANLSQAECLGAVDLDGETYTTYRFMTQTGPKPDGTYFGATYTVYIDPATNRLMRLEQRGQFAHYQPQPGTDVSVSVYSYDPSIQLSEPAQ